MAKLVSGENDLSTWCRLHSREDLLDEWDYETNKGLKNKFGDDISTPFSVMHSSNISVSWVCNEGHRYKAKVGNRVLLNRGCPYCSGNKLLIGYNDFETWCKENEREDLLEEWNYEKNNGLKPSDILRGGAGKKYWWIGSCGHEWESVISSRTVVKSTQNIKTSGCPFCSNPARRILVGFNDLVAWCKNNHREELLSEWDYTKNDILPTQITYGSGKYVWWKCNKNHEWRAQVHNRTKGSKTNCPICSRTQTSFPEQAVAFYLRKKYDILQRYRIYGKEVDVFIPMINVAIEYDGLMWHSAGKQINHDLEKSQRLISKGLTIIRLKESNDVMSVKNEDGQYIIEFIAKNGKYVTPEFDWALKELFRIINTITQDDEMPVISMKEDENHIRTYYMNILKANSVASAFPHLIDEWDVIKNDGITPYVYSARNNKRVWWKCKNGHSWLASINTRGERGLGCPYCAGQRVIVGENDFETWCKTNGLKLLEEWDYEKNSVNPCDIPKTYKDKMHWKCSNGHEWCATVYNRVNGTGCPLCNNGNNGMRYKVSLEDWCVENNSNLCNEWNYDRNIGITPQSVSYGSHIKVWWKCSRGHEWEAQIKSRTYNHGCPFCSSTNRKVIKGINDLETWCKKNDKEHILEEWDVVQNGDLTPSMFTFGSHKRIHWICRHGHRWEAIIKERTKVNGNKCPICRKEF